MAEKAQALAIKQVLPFQVRFSKERGGASSIQAAEVN